MIKQIKYNRNILDFIKFLDSISVDTYDGFAEYVINDTCDLVFRVKEREEIIYIYHCNLIKHKLTFGLCHNEIAYIIDEKFNTKRYKIKIMITENIYDQYEEYNIGY